MAASYRSIRDFDWGLLFLSLLLCAVGILQIFSAGQGNKFRNMWWKQMIFVVAGLVLMWIVSSIDYHTLLGQVPVLYGVTIFLLIVTAFFGVKVFEARRWIELPGGFLFQVSEFGKTMIVLLVARFLTELKTESIHWKDLFKLGALVALPMLFVMRQPDLGTSLTYVPILLMGVFLAGLRWRYALVLGLFAVVLLPSSWFLLKDYQKSRILTFADPARDPKGDGYQVIQSKIAIGNGGMWGQGVTRGTQTRYQFLPVPHTDFVFAAFAEEHGFVGVVVVLGLYFLLLMQIVQNAQTAPDRGGMYICMCIASTLLFHLLVNVGMVIGRMPVTGIPLPLMSNGGSGMLSVFLMLGLVNNVRLRRFVN
ncbi:MAG: rod shape-determining protein RodA [Acidobacteria bacterium]|nr:rod shape-determining protein RodA [Acidobacteriota bacterium]